MLPNEDHNQVIAKDYHGKVESHFKAVCIGKKYVNK